MDDILRFVGIDVSKDHLDVHVRPDDQQQRLTYDSDGLNHLLEMMSQIHRLIVLEATGGFEQQVVAVLASQQLPSRS